MVNAAPPPDDLFLLLMSAARSGNWSGVEEITALVGSQSVPRDADAITEYIRGLKEALIVAKACRADLALSAFRLKAASLFQGIEVDPAGG